MAYFYGNTISSHWRAYGLYTTSTSNTAVTITLHGGFQSIGWGYDLSGVTCTVTNNGTAKSGTGNVSTATGESKNVRLVSDNVVTIARGTSAKTVTLKVSINRSSASYHAGTSSGSVTVTIPALPSYAVTYNANGHGTAPSSQTKYYGVTLALRGAISATGYTFKGWNTNSAGTGTNYAAGASYTGNAALSLYAKWQAVTYTISYNANGGSGAPASATKTYNVTFTISSTAPTRVGYTFLGWATSANATTPSYQPGGSYTSNANTTFYAVWKKAYNFPTITNLAVLRATITVDPDTQEVTQENDDEGTDMHVSFSWTVDAQSEPQDGEVSSITVKWRQRGGTWQTAQAVAPGGTTNGTVDAWFQGDGTTTFLQHMSYDVMISVIDNHDMITTVQDILSTVTYIFDVASGGHGMSIGKPIAPDGTGLQVAWDAVFDKRVTVSGCLNITSTGDIGSTQSSENAPLTIGPLNGVHLEIDQNEIVPKASSNTGGSVYVGEKGSGGTSALRGSTVQLSSTNTITADNNILLDNGKYYQIKNSSGSTWHAVTLNSSNQYTFGNSGYSASTGESFFDGNWVRIRTKQKVTINAKAPIKYTTETLAMGNISSGAGFTKSKTATAQSGYTAVGIVGFNQTHNQAGTVGGCLINTSSRTCYFYGSNNGSSNWTGTNNCQWDILWIANEFL